MLRSHILISISIADVYKFHTEFSLIPNALILCDSQDNPSNQPFVVHESQQGHLFVHQNIYTDSRYLIQIFLPYDSHSFQYAHSQFWRQPPYAADIYAQLLRGSNAEPAVLKILLTFVSGGI